MCWIRFLRNTNSLYVNEIAQLQNLRVGLPFVFFASLRFKRLALNEGVNELAQQKLIALR